MEVVVVQFGKIKTGLLYLKNNDSFYKDITIHMENVADELHCLEEDDETNMQRV